MSELPVSRPIARIPTHPGSLMREILHEQDIQVSEAARQMGISLAALGDVLSGHATVSSALARRFAKLVHGEPKLYLQMQTKHDLWRAAQRLKDESAA